MIRQRLRHALPALISLFVFLVALAVLRVELHSVHWRDLQAAVFATPQPRLWLAMTLTALNYAVLTGYDLLAFSSIGRDVPRRRIAGAALVAYAISHTVGFAALSGASVRYRFYARWGVTAEEMTHVVVSYSITFWIGLLALGGVSLALAPLPDAAFLPAPAVTRAAGVLLVALVAAYILICIVRREPLRVGPVPVRLPRPAMALAQLALSVTDWLLAGSILYLLLPVGAPPFLTVLGAFLAAVLLGMASHVPGGVGVFEGLMVLWLRPWMPAAALLPAFVVYRAVYYLLPFLAGVLALVADEARQRRIHLTRAAGWMGRLTQQLTPQALAAFTFLAGVVLLASGATPAAPGRLDLLDRLLPLGVIETSHFAGSIAGAGLLVLSHGLARRLDAAYYASSLLIVVGMAASLLKGFDVEEAALLLGVLLVLRRARPAFNRRAAFFATRFSPRWIAAVAGTLGASAWLGLFAFQHLDYGADLWWRFELTGEASRSLRASVGAAIAVLLVGIARLVGHPRHEVDAPDEATVDEAAALVAAHPATTANLVFLRDKGVIFDDARGGFVMYGVQGRTWVAMGDPVSPAALQRTLIRRFLERVDDYAGTPVFYEIGHTGLHRYADFGLTFVKLGEEALVDLPSFTVDGGAGARARQTLRRLERDRGTFRLIAPADVPSHLPALRRVSDDWLAHKAAAEKGFSLGFFDEVYVRHFPVGVIERDGAIQAFATLWPGAPGSDLSVDLMRFTADAPKNVMEALLVHVMLWGRGEGYRRFSLGMAPLSGFERSPVAPRWGKIGAFVYEHGEVFYGFQGLRAFKEKFVPVWEPRYLACPGGLALPRVLADVSALIAGGYRRIFLRAPGPPGRRPSAPRLPRRQDTPSVIRTASSGSLAR
ncbi:MAG: bifunctional lysylphosphatidylglycerol flippase/synthetase MprF [Vicinamibacteraceae bacterium]